MVELMRNAFDPDGYPVVAKDFTFAGKRYLKGQGFPWRKLGKDETPMIAHELRGLWLADLIDFPEVVLMDPSPPLATFRRDDHAKKLTRAEKKALKVSRQKAAAARIITVAEALDPDSPSIE